MQTVVWNSSGTSEIGIDAFLRGKRNILLRGEINETSAMDFMDQVMYHTLSDEKTPVKVFINSEGGSIDAGLVIYDIIQSTKLPMNLYCVGMAYSMAAVIMASGKKGNRFILPHSKMMIHEPLIPYGVGGKSSSIKTISENLLKAKSQIEKILSKHTGQSLKKLASLTKNDCYFNAEEAVKFGLADGIMGIDEMIFG